MRQSITDSICSCPPSEPFLSQIGKEVRQATLELLEKAKLQKGDLFVVGCSSSEILGARIGTDSSEAVGLAVFKALQEILEPLEIYIVAQCCEHLNRALILKREAARFYAYPQVNAVPWLKGGGSFATAAYHSFEDPAAVEYVQAAAGLDIGDTLIGMHLRPVAVPVRLSVNAIGSAHLVAARTRPKNIGGCRARYDERIS